MTAPPLRIALARVPASGIEGQDREFIAAISQGRRPESDITSVLPSYRVLAGLHERLVPP